MAKRKNLTPNIEDAEALARLLEDVDFQVDSDDFVLYELSRLIEEERASFEDEEFRRIVDLGIHAHVEENPAVRAIMASRLRKVAPESALKTVHALEDMDSPLRNFTAVLRTYTGYIFRRLQDVAEESQDLEIEARRLLESRQTQALSPEVVAQRLIQIGRPAVGPLADRLFDESENREGTEFALDALGAIRCSSSARVLAHAIYEPILPEDLELRAYNYSRSLWPLARHYILFNLSDHSHEDLPFRWFQLLVQSDEITAVEVILEEIVLHAGNPVYDEDLKVIIELLRLSADPGVEEKVLGLLNSSETPREAIPYLQEFIASFRQNAQSENPWSRADRLIRINKRYMAAAKLFTIGREGEAVEALEAILADEPHYPFAVALKDLIGSHH